MGLSESGRPNYEIYIFSSSQEKFFFVKVFAEYGNMESVLNHLLLSWMRSLRCIVLPTHLHSIAFASLQITDPLQSCYANHSPSELVEKYSPSELVQPQFLFPLMEGLPDLSMTEMNKRHSKQSKKILPVFF